MSDQGAEPQETDVTVDDLVSVLLTGPHYGRQGIVVSRRGVWLDVFLFGNGSKPPVAFRSWQRRVLSR
jgi:hypothetical protein